jgi:hypothetical protein
LQRRRRRRSGKARVVDQTVGMTERASTPLSICPSDPQGRDEAVAQEGAQNSVKKGVYFGTYRLTGAAIRQMFGFMVENGMEWNGIQLCGLNRRRVMNWNNRRFQIRLDFDGFAGIGSQLISLAHSRKAEC